jgi:hypothetical protein
MSVISFIGMKYRITITVAKHYRDIKTENVLVTRSGSVKLGKETLIKRQPNSQNSRLQHRPPITSICTSHDALRHYRLVCSA